MNKCQQEFEKFALQKYLPLDKAGDNPTYYRYKYRYKSSHAENAWIAWCAAWEAAQNLPGAYTEGCSQEDKLRMMCELQVSANKGIKSAIK